MSVALVTGGAAGIGAALCARLAAEGYSVVVADVNTEAAQKVAASVSGIAVTVDVSDPKANQAMVAAAIQAFGQLDLVVLNAGIRSDQSADMALDVVAYRKIIGINMDGVVFGIDAALPVLKPGSTILVMASLVALQPEQAIPVYALAKAAIVAYVRAMATPLTRHGVTIKAICPSFTDTGLLGITGRLLRKQRFPLLEPDDVAHAVLTVLNQAASGEVWTTVPGRPTAKFTFPDVPVALQADGSEAEFKPFLASR